MLATQIAAARDSALKSLSDAHNHFTYTKEAWRTLQRGVKLDGLKLSWQNDSTGSTVDEHGVFLLIQSFVAELTSSTLQQFVSIFENFMFDALRAWLLAHPESLSKRQLSGKDIFALPDKTAIVDALVDKELKDVFYDRPANWFEYLDDRLSAAPPTADERGCFAEIKATRDVLVHGHGVANAYYVDKAGKAARATLGQILDLPEPYHQASWELLCKLVRDIGDAMERKA